MTRRQLRNKILAALAIAAVLFVWGWCVMPWLMGVGA